MCYAQYKKEYLQASTGNSLIENAELVNVTKTGYMILMIRAVLAHGLLQILL